jgi:quinol monooxygenase YgiN
MRYVRNVKFQIKQGKTTEFNKLLNDQVLPVMRQQPGFKQELALVNGQQGLGISIWADQPSAEKYQSSVFPQVMKTLNPVIEGSPLVEHYEVAATTLAL